jgi:hypothetical protein
MTLRDDVSEIDLHPESTGLISTWFESPTVAMASDWRNELKQYRDLLCTAWSRKTAHHRFADQWREHGPRSTGQCGVTSAWLVVVLAGRHGIKATYCYGDVFSTTGPAVLADHCWLEVGDAGDPERLIVDLTCDQVEYFKDEPVLCSSYQELAEHRAVDYRCQARIALDELAGDPVQTRVDELVKELGGLGCL